MTDGTDPVNQPPNRDGIEVMEWRTIANALACSLHEAIGPLHELCDPNCCFVAYALKMYSDAEVAAGDDE